MLKERIITALILLPIVLWCVFGAQGSSAFMAFAGAMVLVGAWEWTALMKVANPAGRGAFVLLVAAGVIAMSLPALESLRTPLYAVSAVFWLMAVRMVIWYPESARWWAKGMVLLPMGLILLIPAWSGLVGLHQVSPWWLMYLFVLVWGADTGAYFTGRAFGKRKLAPAVSPGKTIEGMLGGLALTMAVMVAVGIYRDLPLIRFIAFAGLSLMTVLASVLGDLLESMVKRQAGVKDSGNIFPGHGGALDRIDSLTAAAPVFALGWLLSGGF
jgi:phosphatidate cytidylyltransferase